METTTTFCGNCGRSTAAQDLVVLAGVPVCAACKPAFLRRLQEGVPAPGATLAYRGFWIRFVAKLLDGLFTGVASGLVYFAIFRLFYVRGPYTQGDFGAATFAVNQQLSLLGMTYLIFLAIPIAYSTWMNGKWGATIGKMVIGAVIVNTDGTPIGYGKALGRAFAEWLSGIILCIGYLMAAFDGQKRALHDHICGTLVVARR